jgi:hypothetical protein
LIHHMNDDSTSLDRLHDLALPPEVSWWPLAPGWYVVLSVLLLIVLRVSWQAWARWKANAYRREALQQLAEAEDSSPVAEILRRTALAIALRSEIAELTGDDWLNWLSDRCPRPLPADAGKLLVAGVYCARNSADDSIRSVKALKDYAMCWIKEHEPVPPEGAA